MHSFIIKGQYFNKIFKLKSYNESDQPFELGLVTLYMRLNPLAFIRPSSATINYEVLKCFEVSDCGSVKYLT